MKDYQYLGILGTMDLGIAMITGSLLFGITGIMLGVVSLILQWKRK